MHTPVWLKPRCLSAFGLPAVLCRRQGRVLGSLGSGCEARGLEEPAQEYVHRQKLTPAAFYDFDTCHVKGT